MASGITTTSEAVEPFVSRVVKSTREGAGGLLASVQNFAKNYREGLFGLLMGLIALGLEFLLDDTAFTCPRTNYKTYAITYFVVPAVILFIFNLLTYPALGNVYVWTLCESCFIPDYRRFGDVICRFFSAIIIGFVAPTVWMIVAFFNARYLLCWELGYNLNDNVTADYLRERGISDLNVTRYELKVDHAKAKSSAIGAILLGASVLFLGLFIILRRSCIKPFEIEDEFPALWRVERLEALAASAELEHLLRYGSNLREMPFAVKQLIVFDQMKALERELEDLPEEGAEDKKGEIELELKEYKELMEEWMKFIKLKCSNYLCSDMEEKIQKAKKAFETKKKEVETARNSRIENAEAELEENMKNLPGVDDEERDNAVAKIAYKYWLINKLREQDRHFEFDACSVLEKLTAQEKGELRTQLMMTVKENYKHSPEARGRLVAGRIMDNVRNDPNYFHYHQNAIEMFESIYPRAATGNPIQRYINISTTKNNPYPSFIGWVKDDPETRWERVRGKMKWKKGHDDESVNLIGPG